MIDRKQIRRDVEYVRRNKPTYRRLEILAHHCLALLAELEQAEQRLRAEQRDRNFWAANNSRERAQTEARLAKVPALVEALRQADAEASVAHDAIWSADVHGLGGTGIDILHNSERNDSANSAIWRLHTIIREALAAWEST